MWLDNYTEGKRSGKVQLKTSVAWWRNQLFKFVNKLFTWKGLPFPQKEIETNLILFGHCGLFKVEGTVTSGRVNLYGVTDYIDEFTSFTYATPLHSGSCEIGKNGVLVDNDTLRNPIFPLISRYADYLAHTEITLLNTLINARSNKTAIASNDKVAESVKRYLTRLYEGANEVIVDKSFVGIEFQDNDTSGVNSVKTLWDLRQNILYSFFEDLGIKKNQQKRERLITDEVEADTMLLKLNIKDMYDARVKACEDIKKVFGLDVSVECNVDYDDNGTAEANEEGGSVLNESGDSETVNTTGE